MEATERALRRDSRASQVLGEDAECLSPMGRSYSKTTVNGVSSTSVALQMPVRGNMNQVSATSPCAVSFLERKHKVPLYADVHWRGEKDA